MQAALKVMNSDKLKVASGEECEKILHVLLQIFKARGAENRQYRRDFLQGIIAKKLAKRKKRLFNYFLLQIIELLRISDAVKAVSASPHSF